jgi:hypothetical protein
MSNSHENANALMQQTLLPACPLLRSARRGMVTNTKSSFPGVFSFSTKMILNQPQATGSDGVGVSGGRFECLGHGAGGATV